MVGRYLILAAVAVVFLAALALSPGGSHSPRPASASTTATWADVNCNGIFDPGDPLQVIRETGDLATSQAQFCPLIGTPVTADGVNRFFGDANCDGVADLADALLMVIKFSGATASTGGCPEPGASVQLAVLADALAIDPSWRDYGDAPDGGATGYTGGAGTGSFPTSPANAGPSHAAPFGAWLGEFVSLEMAPNTVDPADDGLLFLQMSECDNSLAMISLNVSGLTDQERQSPVFLNIFADYNHDGDWQDAGGCAGNEHVAVNVPIGVSDVDALSVVTASFVGGDQVDEFWLRVMLTTSMYTVGAAGPIAGETEDYLVVNGQPSDSLVVVAGPQEGRQPAGGPDAAGHQFNCKGAFVGHGEDRTLFLDIEQTQKSKASGFTIRQISLATTQVTNEKRETTNAASFNMGEVTLSQLIDGRARARLALNTNTTEDPPDRLQGPFIVDVSVSGRQQNGTEFSGVLQCAFYVDHTGDGVSMDPGLDGFQGGPSRVPPEAGEGVRFIMAPHNKVITLQSDSLETPADQKATRYDKDSLKVYGPDGMLLAEDDWEEKAGIKKIKVATNGRGLQITPAKDDRPGHQVERVIIRVEGRKPDNTKVVDYYRIVIVHEKGSELKSMIDEYLKSKDVAFYYLNEGDADSITYVTSGGASMITQTPPFGDLTWEDAVTVCETEDDERVHSVFHGSLGYVLDYGPDNSDAYYRAAGTFPDGPCPAQSSTNVTNFGPSSPFYILDAAACDDKVIFTELNTNTDTFRLGAVGTNGSGLGPIEGGDSHRDPSCFMYNLGYGLVASSPASQGTSIGRFVALAPCNALCEAGRVASLSLPEPKTILPATAPNTHERGLVVSPDGTKLAWYRRLDNGTGTTLNSQIWVGDFDPDTQTVTNKRELTTEGFNADPAWSPDSTQIAFTSNRDGNAEIYIMQADGSNQTNFTNTPSLQEFEASWQVP